MSRMLCLAVPDGDDNDDADGFGAARRRGGGCETALVDRRWSPAEVCSVGRSIHLYRSLRCNARMHAGVCGSAHGLFESQCAVTYGLGWVAAQVRAVRALPTRAMQSS